MKILKASAGSGKTYQLSHNYIDLLLNSEDRYAYRNILAVTFTNKATAEMKARILKDLYEMSGSNPKAKRILTDILHDYSAFSISTIDKFFQRALKAFSREIGQFADYQIELDRQAIVTEAMDRILDSLTEDQQELVSWIKTSIARSLSEGKKFSVDEALYSIGKLLKSEQHRSLVESSGIDESRQYSKENLSKISERCVNIIADFERKAADAGLAFKKGDVIKKPGVRALKASEQLTELFENPYKEYLTASLINKQIFSLGLAGEFYRSFDQLLKEKNLMCLEESNTILKDIIDGSDAPFVYEKLGVRYKNFLLDEFQDTSNIQWSNFLPLLRESEGSGGTNLVVGDIKQCIYRFRDSNWTLLEKDVEDKFPAAVIQTLKDNHRSLGTIVNFNNNFFEYASSLLGLSDIYSDVHQNVVKKEASQSGCVMLSFCDNQIERLLESIRQAREEQHASWSDIAILVRGNKEGAAIAQALIEKDIPVISDDSLNIESSTVVRRLMSLLSYYNNPQDSVGAYLASQMGFVFPEMYHSLTDMCEELLRSIRDYNPQQFDSETLYIQAFMDVLQDWTSVNGNDLTRFIKQWGEKKHYIGSPELTDSVRVLTIHKSKGLQFPFVIFPFAEQVDLYRRDVKWCEYKGTLYPVELNSTSENTHFDKAYQEEQQAQKVDNINVFYVALTRATKQMHIISESVPQSFKKTVKGTECEPKNFAQLLYAYCGCMDEAVYGGAYDFSKMERKQETQEELFPSVYSSIALGGRLKPSDESIDFFRRRGIVLHDILSKVNVPEDLEFAISLSISAGSLEKSKKEEVLELLGSRISAHPDWFSSKGRNEVSLINTKGEERRPDRVVTTDSGTTIIDYKFGKKEKSYFYQVAEYVNLYRKMGYRNVKGAIWYVEEDSIEEVI